MILSGPEFKNQSLEKPKQLVLMLHGYGSNGENLIDLASYFTDFLPDAYFISPNAPHKFEMSNLAGGYQWFGLTSRDEDFMYTGIKQAAVILNDYIDEQLARFSLSEENLILLGFSQGAMMSMHVAPRRNNKIAGVVAFSGALIGGKTLPEEIISKPSMLLVHGDQDSVVSYDSMNNSLNILKQNQIPAEGITCKGLDHSINMYGMNQAGSFMKQIIT